MLLNYKSSIFGFFVRFFLGSSEITPAQLQELNRLWGGIRFPQSLDHWLAPFCPGGPQVFCQQLARFEICFEIWKLVSNVLMSYSQKKEKLKENKHQTSWTHTNLFTIYPLAHQKPVNKPEDYRRLVICSVTFSGQKCWLWALVRILHFPGILKGNICY